MPTLASPPMQTQVASSTAVRGQVDGGSSLFVCVAYTCAYPSDRPEVPYVTFYRPPRDSPWYRTELGDN